MNIKMVSDAMKGAAPLRVRSRARAQHDNFQTELAEQQQQHARRMIEARHAVVHIRRKMMIISMCVFHGLFMKVVNDLFLIVLFSSLLNRTSFHK